MFTIIKKHWEITKHAQSDINYVALVLLNDGNKIKTSKIKSGVLINIYPLLFHLRLGSLW